MLLMLRFPPLLLQTIRTELVIFKMIKNRISPIIAVVPILPVE